MGSEWRNSTWGEEISLEYGKRLRGYADAKGPVRVFGTNGPVGWTDEPLAPGPGVIVGRKGAYRGVHYSADPFFVIDTAYYVVPKRDLNMRWLYYTIIYHKLGEINDGSPIPSTTRAAVYVRELKVPPVEEQREIAEILSSLDDKIELNRRTNKVLEGMARAIFKAWFIDFEPVKAKAAGATRFPGMPQHVFDALPNRFVESELGEIPEGWEIKSIYEYCSVIYGAAFSSKKFNDTGNGLPLLRIRDLATHSPKVFTDEEHPKGTIVRQGDIVVGMDGEFRVHIWRGPDSWMNQRVCKFVVSSPHHRAYVAFALELPLAFFERSKVGTTVIHLGKRDIDSFELIAPPESLLEAFGRIVEPLIDATLANESESLVLQSVCDTLLPKLISGEISVARTSGGGDGE